MTRNLTFHEKNHNNDNESDIIYSVMELALFKIFSDPVRPNTVSLDHNGSSEGSSSSSMTTPTRSTTDLPNRVGNTARREDGELMYNEIVESQQQHRRPSEFQQHQSQQRKQWWESNYKEAAIFLEVKLKIAF